MGKVKGFKDYDRIDEKYIPVRKRLKNYKEFTISPKNKELKFKLQDAWIVVFLSVIVDVH